MRRRWLISVALVLGGLVAVGLGAGPLVAWRVRALAAARGLTVEIGAVRPGWGRLWLRDVTWSVPAVAGVSGGAQAVEVRLEAGRLSAVTVYGGHVELDGSRRALLEGLESWRSRGGSGSGTVTGPRRPRLAVEGVQVHWRDSEHAREWHVWGLRATATDGGWGLGADRVRLHAGEGDVELGGVELELREQAPGWSLGRATLAEASLSLESSALGLERSGEAMAVSSAAAAAGAAGRGVPAQPPRRPEPARDAPNDAPLRRWAEELPPLDAGRGARWRALVDERLALVARALPPGTELHIAKLRLSWAHAGETLRLGPGGLTVRRSGAELRVTFTSAGTASGTKLDLDLQAPLEGGELALSVEGGPITLAELGVQEGSFGLVETTRSRLEARLRGTWSRDGGELALAGRLALAELALERAWLSPTRVVGLGVELRGAVSASLDAARLRLTEASLALGPLRLTGELDLTRGTDALELTLAGGIPLASCADLLGALPHGLAPLLEGLSAEGTFAAQGELSLDAQRGELLRQRWSVTNACRWRATSPLVDAQRFTRPFEQDIRDVDGRPGRRETGPGTPSWTPLGAISRHMETAVLICEDGRFWKHAGFDQEAIENSLRENLRAGRFVRGASTLTMQLAKNLYLSREKTVTRKLQEAFLTMLLEQQLGKDRILELYLNVVEFGPGIYGIGAASHYYFASAPSQLSLGQALYLASILPNPRAQHFLANGLVSPGWSSTLRKLMVIAKKLRRIDEAELQEALGEQVAFRVPYRAPDGAPPAPEEALPDGWLAPDVEGP